MEYNNVCVPGKKSSEDKNVAIASGFGGNDDFSLKEVSLTMTIFI